MGWKMITSTVTAISIIIGGVFTIYDLEPRNFAPVLYFEIQDIIKVTDSIKLGRLRAELTQLRLHVDRLAIENQGVPQWLKLRIREVKKQIGDIEAG